jgi:hypothetical protein
MIDQIWQRGWGRKLGLFWLVVIIAIGIVFVVDRFLVAPAMAAGGFPSLVPTPTPTPIGLPRELEISVSGLFWVMLLTISRQRRVLGACILVATWMPIGNIFTVLSCEGKAAIIPLPVHRSTAIYTIVIGVLLLKVISSDSKSPI